MRFAFLLAALFATAVSAQPALYRAEEIAKSPADQVRLFKGSNRQLVGTVSPARVRAILEAQKRIEARAGIRAELALMEGRQPNAFATPTGKGGPLVGISLGMIDLVQDDRDAYAAILGHEYAHLTLKHREARVNRELARQAGTVVLGLLLGYAGAPMPGELSNLATSAVTTKFSRDEERAADEAGLRYAAAAGYDPLGAVRVWERMAARGERSIPFLSTHPASQERVENMRSLARSLGAGAAAPAN